MSEPEKKYPLTQIEAEMRKSLLTKEDGTYNVKYNLTLTTRRESDKKAEEKHDFEGNLECHFLYFPKPEIKEPNLFLNFAGEIHELKINGTKVEKYTYEKHRLYYSLDLLKPNENNVVNVIFSGDYNHNGVGLHHYTDPADKKEYLYTQFEPYDCNRLFPCFDQPNIKAVLDLKVIAPKEWIVLSNAFEKEITDYIDENSISSFNLSPEAIKHLVLDHEIKDKKYHIYIFNETPKISTYLYALCEGPYYCIKNEKYPYSIPLRLFMRESLKDYGEPDEIFRVTIAGMKFYGDYFGIPFQFAKYDQIFCPEYNMGAMENVGLITLNEFYCWKDTPTQRRRTGFAITVLHELAHMWFGDLVTMNWWNDLWLNESFATFISHLCMANSDDLNKEYNTSWVLFGDYKGGAYSADQLPTTHPVMSEVKDTDVAETDFDMIVYEKGSSMVKQMYYYIGDEAFSKGLKNYFQKYKWGNTVFDNFIDEMINAAGDKLKDLKVLCHKWLQLAGLNEIWVDMEADENTKKITKFIVKQKPCLESHPNLQNHMVDFLFIYDFNDTSKNKVFKRMFIEEKNETSFDFSNELQPKMVFLNYNDWGYMKLSFDRKSLDGIKEGFSDFKDPLTKQLVYRSLYDQCRDAKISPIEYLDIIFTLIKKEKDDNNLMALLRHCHSTIRDFLPLNNVIEYKKKYFHLMLETFNEELSKIHFSKDIVKQLLIFLPANCTDDEDRKILIKFLNMDPKIISQENRFKFVENIFKSRTIPKEVKEEMFKIEEERDKKSDQSVQSKLTCEAGIPTKENKELIWDKILNSKDSLYNLQSLMYAFAPYDQLDLVQDYVKNKFFEVLPDLGKKKESFFIDTFVDCCSPDYYTDDETIKKMEDLVQKVSDMSQVKKYVSEKLDYMKRRKIAQQLAEDYIKNKK